MRSDITLPAVGGLPDWIRLSLNIIDTNNQSQQDAFKRNAQELKALAPKVTACYVASNQFIEHVPNVIELSRSLDVVTRITPDCIMPEDDIAALVARLNEMTKNVENVFVSEASNGDRGNSRCYMHHIKPFLFTDGYVYSCPSAELSPENGRKLPEAFRVCAADDIYKFFNETAKNSAKERPCKFCKYAEQNQFVESLLIETEDNDFC